MSSCLKITNSQRVTLDRRFSNFFIIRLWHKEPRRKCVGICKIYRLRNVEVLSFASGESRMQQAQTAWGCDAQPPDGKGNYFLESTLHRTSPRFVFPLLKTQQIDTFHDFILFSTIPLQFHEISIFVLCILKFHSSRKYRNALFK